MAKKVLLQSFQSLDDFQKNLHEIDFKTPDFEKSVSDFIIQKVKSGGLENSPQLAEAIFSSLQAMGEKNNKHFTFKEGKSILAQIKIAIDQRNYVELLDRFLESKIVDPNVSLLQKKENASTKQTLLPESEYDAPREPGYWGEVGIADAAAESFNPSAPTKSIFERFSTQYLKNLFVYSFPWAADISPKKTQEIAQSPKKNLLEIKEMLPGDIQFIIIEILLLCLDGLGKACGKNGEHSLENYDDIKYISDISQALADDLKKLINQKITPDTFRKKADSYLSNLMKKNEALYNEHFRNTAMNNFCHHHEDFLKVIFGIEHPSVLMPKVPNDRGRGHFKKS